MTTYDEELTRRVEHMMEKDDLLDEDGNTKTPEQARQEWRDYFTKSDAKLADDDRLVAAGEAQRVQVRLEYITTLLTRLSPDELYELVSTAVMKAGEELVEELQDPDRQVPHLEYVIESEADMRSQDPTMFYSTAAAKDLLSSGKAAVLGTVDTLLWTVSGQGYVLGSTEELLAELRNVSAELADQKETLTARRNDLIRQLSKDGVGSTTVARAAGMGTSSLFKITKGQS